jgi:hypothetical protein
MDVNSWLRSTRRNNASIKERNQLGLMPQNGVLRPKKNYISANDVIIPTTLFGPTPERY